MQALFTEPCTDLTVSSSRSIEEFSNRPISSREAATEDLQKFIVYYYKNFPDGNLEHWTKNVTSAFFKFLRNYRLSTKRRVHWSLKAFSTYLTRKRIISYDEDPVRAYKLPEPEVPPPQPLQTTIVSTGKILEGNEVFKLLLETAQELTHKSSNKKKVPLRNIAILFCLYYTGLMPIQIVQLTLEQVQPDSNSKGAFLRGVITKSGTIHEDIYLPEAGFNALRDYLDKERSKLVNESKKENSLIFLSDNGHSLRRTDIERIINDIKIETIKRFAHSGANSLKINAFPKNFRNERAYLLLQAGLTETEVARELGIKVPTYISRYTARSIKKQTKSDKSAYSKKRV